MRESIVLIVHVITTLFRLAQPGGVRGVIAESVHVKHQLLILNRSRRRAPNLNVWDRLIAGLFVLDYSAPTSESRNRPQASDVVEFPSRSGAAQISAAVFAKREGQTRSKGPDPDVIRAVVEMKQRNPTWGCPRIADQINLAFGTSINKDVVRRILALQYRPPPNADGPSWPILRSYEGQPVEY